MAEISREKLRNYIYKSFEMAKGETDEATFILEKMRELDYLVNNTTNLDTDDENGIFFDSSVGFRRLP